MTTALASQSGAEVLFRVLPAVEASQSGAEYLFRITPTITISQGGAEYLHRVQPAFAISQSGAEVLFKSQGCTTKRAQIWSIVRTDGEVLRFTSLDRDLTYRGNTYSACNSMSPSASENVAELGSVGNIELSGLIASGAISLADLHAGRFDGAAVEAWLVPWDGDETAHALLRGTFGQVSYSENIFSVDILGDGGRLTQTPLVKTLQPGCRFQFGDSNCGKDLGPLTVTGTVDSGTGQRGFTDAARAEAAGYFSRGRVTFTGGNNNGLSAEIKEHSAGGVFTLWPRLAFPIDAGDTYSLVPGCTNFQATANGINGCDDWANFVNYGGFPSVPGSDAVSKSANVRRK